MSYNSLWTMGVNTLNFCARFLGVRVNLMGYPLHCGGIKTGHKKKEKKKILDTVKRYEGA